MPVEEFVRGDTKPSLYFTITDDDGVAVNISTCTVNFYFKKVGATALTNVGHTLCTITDGPNGVCRYDWGATDLAVSDLYIGELEVTYADASKQTVQRTWSMMVRDDVD